MPLSEKIKGLRKEKGWSQFLLGEKIGVHGKHISKWENGKFVPSCDALKKLAEVFEVSDDYLLFDNVSRCPTEFTDPEITEKLGKLGMDDREAVKRIIRAMVRSAEL